MLLNFISNLRPLEKLFVDYVSTGQKWFYKNMSMRWKQSTAVETLVLWRSACSDAVRKQR